MIQLAIHVDLLPNKLHEFTHSWESFIDHVKNSKDLASYSMKPDGKNACDIELNCTNKKHLDLFMKDEWYKFLYGAIQTLGDRSETKRIQIKT